MTRVVVFLVLMAPALVQSGRYLAGTVFYGEYLHWTGAWATYLVLAVLAVSPIRWLTPRAAWSRWLVVQRRELGIVAFIYAFLHALAYLAYKADLSLILKESASWGMVTGWLALIVFALLAGTSNGASVRRLGQRWKTLHRWVYAGAGLTLAHWILTAFDPSDAYPALTILALLLLWRLWRQWWAARGGQRPAPPASR